MTNPETSSDLAKALEWIGDAPFASATRPFGAWYFINPVEGGFRIVYGSGPVLATFDEAKAAAQADYTARILSSIDTPTIERLTAERDEAREAQQKAETALLLSDEAIQYVSVTLGGPDEWSDQESMIYSIRASAETAESLNARQGEALKEIADASRGSFSDDEAKRSLAAINIRARAALATESSNG